METLTKWLRLDFQFKSRPKIVIKSLRKFNVLGPGVH